MSYKPNLFIIGVAKGGTTALANFLAGHPSIYMAETKEPNYFSAESLQKRKLYYGNTYLNSEQSYLDLFKNGESCKWRGEASVSYFQFAETASKIKQYSPNAKLILLLRNPIKRAISHYLMDSRLGYVSVGLDEIIEKKEQFEPYFFQYIEHGLYYQRILEFKKYFSPNQLLVLDGGDGLDIKKESLAFLGLNTIEEKEVERNQSLTLKNAYLAKLYQSETVRQVANALVPRQLKVKLKSSSLFTKQEYELKSQNLRYLKEYFLQDQENVLKLLSNKGGE